MVFDFIFSLLLSCLFFMISNTCTLPAGQGLRRHSQLPSSFPGFRISWGSNDLLIPFMIPISSSGLE